jgi:tetratricopeptide (TPR) repeat protein
LRAFVRGNYNNGLTRIVGLFSHSEPAIGTKPRPNLSSFPRSRLALLLMAALVGLSSAEFSRAQSGVSGSASVEGIVQDAHQHPVADALVTLKADRLGAPLTTRTEVHGHFRFANVRPGNYQVIASAAPGTASYGPLELHDQDAPKLSLTLTKSSSAQDAPAFFDEPNFTVAGVAEGSGAGGHGSDAVRRKTEDLTKATTELGGASAQGSPSLAAADSGHGDHEADDLRQRISQDDRAELHHQLAAVEEREGHPLEAVREYQRAAEMDPSEGNLFDWGTELLAHRATEPAIEVFGQGNRLYPKSARMLTGLGVAEFARGSYEQAAARLCQASDLDPKDPIPYRFLGKMQTVQGVRSEAVVAHLARFARLRPADADAHYYYAVAMWSQRRNDEDTAAFSATQTSLKKAMALDPKFASAYLQLGILYAAQGQLPQAAEQYERAIAADPALEEAHYRLGQTYRRLGQTEKASEELAIYQRLAQAADERANRERKAVLQFVYELKAAPDKPTPR